jgi:hypothetical protein
MMAFVVVWSRPATVAKILAQTFAYSSRVVSVIHALFHLREVMLWRNMTCRLIHAITVWFESVTVCKCSHVFALYWQ